HFCNNTAGSFGCLCPAGYQLIHDDHTCSDIDECSAISHGCSQLCNNTVGSYRCACISGYRLSSNHKTCTAVHEVTSSKHVNKPSSISKAMGALVALVTISVLSVGAIAVLLVGFYRG
ncbi:hypothetical protein, partial [Salmonella sp. s54925]|uniref:hypothetical protein n=1 Tax=Salmonella sp. s54925 TaxID=3159674 RepID=UPI00397EBBA3